MGLYGNGVSSPELSSQIAGAEFTGGFSRDFLPQLKTEISAGLQLETGTAQARFSDEFNPKQAFRLREASVQYNPFSFLKLGVGALNQDRWQNNLLLNKRTFPSLEESVSMGAGAWALSLTGVQSIASDTSTLQPWGNWNVGLPHFFMERLGVEHSLTKVKTKAWASHFLFENLPTAVAYQSSFLGNTVRTLGPSLSDFAYGFQGVELGTRQDIFIDTLTCSWGTKWISNLHAPAGGARELWSRVSIPISSGINLVPEARIFLIESDAVPAFFNDRTTGHTNRRGYALRLGMEWLKEQLEVVGEFSDSRVVVPDSHQNDLVWLQFLLRTHYEIL
jgi:hypothetical protein